MSNKKNNFIVDFSNTMGTWVRNANIFDWSTSNEYIGTSQAGPDRGQDPIRKDMAALWYPYGLPQLWRWGRDADVLSFTPFGSPRGSALLKGTEYRHIFGSGSPITYSDTPLTPEDPADITGRESRFIDDDRATYPYGRIQQMIRIEGNRGTIPGGNDMLWGVDDYAAGGDMNVTFPSLPDWRRYCIEKYYGRYTSGPMQGHYKQYVDHATSYQSPFTPMEWLFNPLRIHALAKFEYNFYTERYEKLLAGLGPNSHTIYPHLYTMFLEKSRGLGLRPMGPGGGGSIIEANRIAAGGDISEPSSYNASLTYHDFVTLNRTIDNVFINTIRRERFDPFIGMRHAALQPPEKAGERDEGEYFDKWTDAYLSLYSPPPGSAPSGELSGVNILTSKYKNVIFTKSSIREVSTYDPYKELFPMYAKIFLPFSDDYTAHFSDELNPDFFKQNITKFSSIQRVWAGFHDVGASDFAYEGVKFAENHQGIVGGMYAQPDNITSGTERRIFDIGQLFDVLRTPGATNADDIFYLNDFVQLKSVVGATTDIPTFGAYGYETQTNIQEQADEILLSSATPAALSTFVETVNNNLTNLSRQYLRSYTEILEGAQSFSTSLFYRINKYSKDTLFGTRGDLLQSFFVPQPVDGGEKFIEMLDTQLRYNNTYEYEILIYRTVIGSKYKFLQLFVPRTDEIGTAHFDVRTVGGSEEKSLDYYGIVEFYTDTADFPSRTPLSTLRYQEPDSAGSPEYLSEGTPQLASDLTWYSGPTIPGYEDPRLVGFPTFFPGSYERSGNPFFAEVEVLVEPSIAVVELPYVASNLPWTGIHPFVAQVLQIPAPEAGIPDYSFGIGTISDKPGVSPDVEILPYRGVGNKLLFNLATGAGETFGRAVPLSEAEEEYYQGVSGPFGVKYANDDPASAFEIYRSDSYPANYSDFANKRIAVISTQQELLDYRRSSSTSYVDDIAPNRKYYYMVRSLDIHNHPSRPSAIYEVEMVESDGAVYPRIRVVEPSSVRDNKASIKNMRRFLQLKPQVSQRLFNAEATYEPLEQELNSSAPVTNDVVLGYPPEKPWGNTYKIRLTSRSSGKKIDLNVKFNKEYIDQRNDGEET